MILLAIDPGNVQSAYCYYDTKQQKPIQFTTLTNGSFIETFCEQVVIEKIASYGMAVGESIFETCVWTGRLIEKFEHIQIPVDRITRKDVKMHLCGSMRAKDSNIIQVLKDRFGEKGTKKKPGLLYGIKADEWQSLALAVTYAETKV